MPAVSERPPPTINAKTCVGCGDVAPPTDSNHTLISVVHGWRVTRVVDDRTGRAIVHWRCQGCWVKYRAKVQRNRPRSP